MKHYNHLSASEREEISRGLAQDKSMRCIAIKLNRNVSSIIREIKRNRRPKNGIYRAVSAQRTAENHLKMPRRPRKLHSGSWLWSEVESLLRQQWSPDQIAAYIKETYPLDVEKHISHEAIYQAIYVLPRGTLRKELTDCLRRSHRHRRKRRYLRQDRRGQIPDMVSIHDRPKEVESREIPGHWEGDLIVGKYNTSAIGTLVERTSRKILICKLDSRTSNDVIHAFEKRLKNLPCSLRSTLTYDRGKEMTEHQKLTMHAKIKVFFCDPQSPWQRGTNENTNGLVRQYFPKGTDFTNVSEEELLFVEKRLNDRPRKCLRYLTPDEVFSSHLSVALES